jgi:hypothetical protein
MATRSPVDGCQSCAAIENNQTAERLDDEMSGACAAFAVARLGKTYKCQNSGMSGSDPRGWISKNSSRCRRCVR